MEKRKGFKLLKEFPTGENCVGIIKFKGEIIVATNNHIYKIVDDVLEKLEISYEDGKLK